jgi:endogenous inhibitor of DNA gyrase (YacG/DUF329 family)
LAETANDARGKYCSNCGKKVENPIKFEGYVFCSDQCRESFTIPRGEGSRSKDDERKWRHGATKGDAG